MWFLFNWPADNLGDTLVDNVQAFFTLGLRDQVMRSILRQDREYFDFHQAGVLQERLNRDTDMLSNQAIQQPKNFLSAITRILVRSGIMYQADPRLFRVAILVPIPATVFLMLPQQFPWFQGCGPPQRKLPNDSFLDTSQAKSTAPGARATPSFRLLRPREG